MIDQQSVLTPRQASRYIGISEAALRLWRAEGRGPRHFRAGEKLVRYRKADLDSWIEERLSAPPVEASRTFSHSSEPPMPVALSNLSGK